MTPLETLKSLVALQEVDLRIREIERDRQHIPARLKQIEDTLSGKRASLANLRNVLDEAELNRRMLESDLRAEKEKVKKWEARLNELKNNRDFQALSREIEATRKANLGIEDEILRKMQEIEDLKSQSQREAEELEILEKELSQERGGLEANLKTLNAKISSQEVLRRDVLPMIEPRWLHQYDTIRKRRDGIAVVPTMNEHCHGCNMGIPPQLYNMILRGQEIESCPHCHRILYFESAIKPPADKPASKNPSPSEPA